MSPSPSLNLSEHTETYHTNHSRLNRSLICRLQLNSLHRNPPFTFSLHAGGKHHLSASLSCIISGLLSFTSIDRKTHSLEQHTWQCPLEKFETLRRSTSRSAFFPATLRPVITIDAATALLSTEINPFASVVHPKLSYPSPPKDHNHRPTKIISIA